MKDFINNSPLFSKKQEKLNTEINNNEDKYNLEKKYSDFNLGSDYFNLNDESKNKILDDNSIYSSMTSEEEEDNFKFYKVAKTKTLNYTTPIKIGTSKNKQKNGGVEKNKTKKEISKEVSSISSSDVEDKKVMISELDIELSNNSKNSNKNYLMSDKKDKNNINMIKKRQNDFKKQIEQNLKKFLKSNQENNKEYNNKIKNDINNDNVNNINNKEIINDKNNIKLKMRLKKHTQNINYCITDINRKIIRFKKSNNSNKNNINNNSNQLLPITSVKKTKTKLINNNLNNNKPLNSKRSNVSKKFFNKKLNEFIKINLAKKTKKNTEKNVYKNRLLYLQNQKFNEKMIRPYDFSDFIITKRNINNSNFNNNNFHNSTEKIRNDFFSTSEKKRVLDKKEKFKYNTSTKKGNSNINEKNIIIQNFNCIDYNSINININNNNNNNVMKAHKLFHQRNIDKSNISNNNTQKSYNTTITKKIFNKKDDINEINSFYKSYIKNFYKNQPNLKNEKPIKFQRKKSDKKMTFVDNNLDIKSKILNYINNKKQTSKLNVKNREQNKIQNKLSIKTNDIEFKKYFNTIETNAIAISKQKTLRKNFKNNFVKLLMAKK